MENNDSKHLAQFKVLTFDCYGTLMDRETGTWEATARPDKIPQTDFLLHSMADLAAAVAGEGE